MSPRAKRQPKTEAGPTTPKGSFKEVIKRGDDQAPLTQFMSPKKLASRVEKVINEQEERLEDMDPILQDLKQKVQLGAAGRRVVKAGGEDVEMSETETDEDPLKRKRSGAKRKTTAGEEKPSKRRETETEDEAPPPKNKKEEKKKRKAREERTGAEEDRSRRLLEDRKPADPKASRSRSIEVLTRMQREGESVRRRRLDRSARFFDYIQKHPEQFPVVERTKKGKAVPVEGQGLDRLYEQGCKVIVVTDPGEPRAKYWFLIFLELDLVVRSELGPLPANAIYRGQLFMPHDFPTAFGLCKAKNGVVEEPLTVLIIEEVVNMALGPEVEEYRQQRNRAMLASWGVLTREEDELRTMTWADFGFRYNIEPFRTEAVSTWVTLPEGAADNWINDTKMDMSRALDSLEVWNDAGTQVLPKFIQRRNFKGLDGLRITYGDSQRMAEKADPDGAVKLRSEPATLTTFWANNQTAPKKDEGHKRSPQALPTGESSGKDSKEKAERKRQRKKEAKGEAINPVPFFIVGAHGARAGGRIWRGGLRSRRLRRYGEKEEQTAPEALLALAQGG
jgi:hypothetical protein